MAISKANEANRFSVENAVQPANFVISESMEAECQDHFDSIKLLLGTLGLPVFKRLNEASPVAEGMDQVFMLKHKGTNARGAMSDEGFVILEGSRGPLAVTQSFWDGKKVLREKLIERGVLKVEGDEIVFTEDLLMGTPSGAAVLVCGRSANGWTSWINDKGVTIDAIFRKAKD